MFFRGREIVHQDVGQKIISRFVKDISDVGEVERNDGLEGKMIHMYFAPISTVKKTSEPQDSPKKGKEKTHGKNEKNETENK